MRDRRLGGQLLSVAIWVLAVIVIAWTVVRILGLERGFPLVPLVAYTPYVALAAPFLAVLAAAFSRFAPAALAAVATVALAITVLPRAFGGDDPVDGARTLRIATANLKLGEGEVDAVLELAQDRRLDVLSIQELTPRSLRRLRRLGIQRLLPHSVIDPAPGSSGSGLLARYPLRRLPGIENAVGDIAMPRATMRIPGQRSLEIVAVHTAPPTGSLAVDRWEAGIRALPAADTSGASRLLLGDFNATLDHAELRELIDSGYRDAADATGTGLLPTWKAGRWLPLTIDHLLVPVDIGVRGVEVDDIPGSDHDAVSAELVLPRTAPGRR